MWEVKSNRQLQDNSQHGFNCLASEECKGKEGTSRYAYRETTTSSKRLTKEHSDGSDGY